MKPEQYSMIERLINADVFNEEIKSHLLHIIVYRFDSISSNNISESMESEENKAIIYINECQFEYMNDEQMEADEQNVFTILGLTY